MGTPEFVPALALNRDFYTEAVKRLLDGVPHSAAMLGWGSDVLGFDTARSTDHGWGPRLVVFVDRSAVTDVSSRLDAGLPDTFGGWPVRYGWDEHPVEHRVEVCPLDEWLVRKLGVDATQPLSTADWLLMPQQKMLEVTKGAVYHDDTGDLTEVRTRLAYFPDEVWRWLLACQWRRIAQEEAFVGRAAEVDDELGSRIIAARLARELMRQWFLFERTYWPYTKWFGSAFARLPDSAPLSAALADALAAENYGAREAALVRAYEMVAARHNALEITPPVDPTTRDFYGRPFRVLMADRFTDACLDAVDAHLKALPLYGSIDQVVDSTDVLSYTEHAQRLHSLYAEEQARQA